MLFFYQVLLPAGQPPNPCIDPFKTLQHGPVICIRAPKPISFMFKVVPTYSGFLFPTVLLNGNMNNNTYHFLKLYYAPLYLIF